MGWGEVGGRSWQQWPSQWFWMKLKDRNFKGKHVQDIQYMLSKFTEKSARKQTGDEPSSLFQTFLSFQRRMMENVSKGFESSSQSLIQNMCLLLNISMLPNNGMACRQNKYILNISHVLL